MSTLKNSVVFGAIVLIGIWSGACRKRSAQPGSTAPSETAPSATPAASPGSAAAPAPVKTLSTKDETEIRKRYMPPGSSWASKTPDQKQMAYFGWCQVYMLGDAATKAKVLAEIKQANLSAEELAALKKKNSDMRIPLLPL